MRERNVIKDLNHIRVFARVAELKSITGAARVLGMPKSTVSRDLARLEAGIGAALLQRSNRRVELTDTGVSFYRHARQILGEIEDAEIALSQARATPRGLLRVSAPFTSGHMLLAPLLPAFLERYPDIQIALDLDNRRVDLLTDDVDVAIRVGRLEDSSLTVRKLAAVEFGFFASPTYLRKRPQPRTLADLAGHDVVESGGPPVPRTWTVDGSDGRSEVRVLPRLSVNDPSTVRLAVIGGVGIGWLPFFLIDEDVAAGRLIPVLSSYRGEPTEIHALFPHRRSLAPKIRAFIDYLTASWSLVHSSGAAAIRFQRLPERAPVRLSRRDTSIRRV